jgi:hypothetical protein
MTVTRDEALSLISAHGAAPARWPATARAAVLALAAEDAVVGAALAEARALDALIGEWASPVPARQFEVAALIPQPAQVRSVGRSGTGRLWIGGGALAASVVAALLLALPAQQPVIPAPQLASNQVSLGSASGQGESMDDFALIFTPTADEEDLI